MASMKRAHDDLDIITIRHNRGMPDPSLKEVIQQVRDAGYADTAFHGSSCREPSLPWKSERGLGRHTEPGTGGLNTPAVRPVRDL